MKKVICVIAFFATLSCSLTLPAEESHSSVVSVYTTLTPETTGPSVYQQLASNLASKITSPILTFLGIANKTTTQAPVTSKKPLLNLETFDEAGLKPVDNHLRPIERDVEELAPNRRVQDSKPEKFTLYSSYSPKNDTNSTAGAEADDETARQGGLVYFLELMGSIAQLAIGALMAIFKPAASAESDTSKLMPPLSLK